MRIEKYENDEIPVVVGKGDSMYYIYDDSVWKYNGSRPPPVKHAFELDTVESLEEGRYVISEKIGEKVEEKEDSKPSFVTEEKQQKNELNEDSKEEKEVESELPPFMRDN